MSNQIVFTNQIVFIDDFDALDKIPKTYEELKAAVLKAGRFSCFEASSTQRSARLFDKLYKDPEIKLDNKTLGYPWTIVTRINKD